ncbi:MAG: alkaline phosphatase D family protein [Verrucomicrobiota bacterium JB023]|nr:alkaline phosphatase D family protein [Verrucomicrobiota bacterium JB023]
MKLLSILLLLTGFTHGVILPQGTEYFRHGVASGDPLPDGIILWTRITPSEDDLPGRVAEDRPDIEVGYEIATDENFSHIIHSGTTLAQAASDYTIKVDPRQLTPATNYYYRFTYQGTQSLVGRAKTAPEDSSPAGTRFGLVSCANYEAGLFSAYRYLAQREDLDFILHGGDYIYEYPHNVYPAPAEAGRVHDPLVEIINLEHYRRRHAKYKADLDLQLLHQKVPFICTWDDHESTNDSHRTGAENHTEGDEGNWIQRQSWAYQAYFEWMPIRLPDPTHAPQRIYRNWQYGSHVELITLDLRQYRDAPPSQAELIAGATDRTNLGPEQKTWFKNVLSESSATWKLINNAHMITPVDLPALAVPDVREAIEAFASEGVSPLNSLTLGQPYNTDQWDGFPDERQEILDHLDEQDINNVAFLTGDIHSLWACEVPKNKTAYKLPASALNPDGERAVAIEIVCPSITSDNLNEILGAEPRTLTLAVEETFMAQNPWIKDIELDSHGFTVVDVNADRIRADWFFISDRAARNPSLKFYRGYTADAWDLTGAGEAAIVEETENRLPPR